MDAVFKALADYFSKAKSCVPREDVFIDAYRLGAESERDRVCVWTWQWGGGQGKGIYGYATNCGRKYSNTPNHDLRCGCGGKIEVSG